MSMNVIGKAMAAAVLGYTVITPTYADGTKKQTIPHAASPIMDLIPEYRDIVDSPADLLDAAVRNIEFRSFKEMRKLAMANVSDQFYLCLTAATSGCLIHYFFARDSSHNQKNWPEFFGSFFNGNYKLTDVGFDEYGDGKTNRIISVTNGKARFEEIPPIEEIVSQDPET
jgi:hypothetical protein